MRIVLFTYDFPTLYTTLPHDLLKINLLILSKEYSIENALFTLHVTTETHFVYFRKPKNIMHCLVKMYVMRWPFL